MHPRYTSQAKCINMIMYSIVTILLPMTTCYLLISLHQNNQEIFYTASDFWSPVTHWRSFSYENLRIRSFNTSATIFCIFLPASLSSRRRRSDSFPTPIYASSGHDDPSPVRLRRYFIRSVSSPFLYELNSPIIPPSLNFSRSVQTHFDSVALLLFIRLPSFRRWGDYFRVAHAKWSYR